MSATSAVQARLSAAITEANDLISGDTRLVIACRAQAHVARALEELHEEGLISKYVMPSVVEAGGGLDVQVHWSDA